VEVHNLALLLQEIYGNIDGCSFLAVLDNSVSTTENLIYKIVEAERVALYGYTTINDQEKANELNKEKTTESSDTEKMQSSYLQGFQ
jgi:ferritin-like protein